MAFDSTENAERPTFPKRAVITGGMPYGNKNLHFGHVGGVFVPADFFARFLRDRIGLRMSFLSLAQTATAPPLWRDIASELKRVIPEPS